ncbi:hypothetical protein GUITHDRAFT_104306 [Guillardia theta CCMP2712]|uniref:Pherophorin domain-containing protein n=1 Tax=Guillardia theta (strain CCMP2712) TaxID=905079 RepID=L1JNQ6_GUITC|nr:hypothetical protein GUITHDRAFT_104306 [Guillardia theta CCMP2712]EKX49909.1 hypothetical protein GUITHDRAFT_104306 [Guillardia theta CCMP2712]|mmetsp:Transcript_15064/g.50874  ORF Transcript_15064/g.50874 Transcript_15064/m.50874 type:complete len:260 (-) Transcript_15064:89-868(-)|eukprot:XP_005836889.1 hypothetical protein GUITHDRAFT_104306 [Guillardia theta CCMP2712]
MLPRSSARSLSVYLAVFVLSCSHVLTANDDDADGGGKVKLKFSYPRRVPRVSMSTINSMNKLMPPKPASWPTAFSIKFRTNITQGSTKQQREGLLWYDASQGQRIFHQRGSSECVQYYKTKENCSLVFNSEGMYALVSSSSSSSSSCCLDLPNFHAPRPNWTQTKHTFIETKKINGRMCHGFRYAETSFSRSHAAKGHVYWQDVKTGLPCAFMFDDSDFDWYFDVTSVLYGPQDAKLFAVSAECISQKCSTDASRSSVA